jgi:tetratricopeptide (TPR) repeat protein
MLYSSRGLAYLENGEPNLAVADYTKAIAYDPEFGPAYGRANVYFEIGLFELAIADYSKLIELDGGGEDLAEVYLARGIAYGIAGRNAPAILDFNKTLELRPGDARAYAGRAFVYYHTGQYDEAWTDVSEAQALEYKVDANFLKALQEASRRKK